MLKSALPLFLIVELSIPGFHACPQVNGVNDAVSARAIIMVMMMMMMSICYLGMVSTFITGLRVAILF